MKTWAQMREEVFEVNKKLGWWDKPVSFPAAMCLLHSEVSEALEAWRKWGLEDKTAPVVLDDFPEEVEILRPPKPEGFASEIADVMIRLLDDDQRFGLSLGEYWDDKPRYGFGMNLHEYVAENLNALHLHIAMASYAFDNVLDDTGVTGVAAWRQPLADLLIRIIQLAEYYRIDLPAEYDRKLAYNRTRPYRHGKAV